MKTSADYQAKRLELKEISNTFAPLKENGTINTINEGLKAYYMKEGHRELKTFAQWELSGMKVKKGMKALYMWGKQTTKTVTDNGETKEIIFCPLVALFSDLQVYNPQNNR